MSLLTQMKNTVRVSGLLSDEPVISVCNKPLRGHQGRRTADAQKTICHFSVFFLIVQVFIGGDGECVLLVCHG